VGVRSIRGDALLASVKRGGGSYKGPWYNVYRLAAGALISEAVLRGVVAVDGGNLIPGDTDDGGALGELAEHVRAASRPEPIKEWLERTGPWARQAIERELAADGAARGVVRRILLGSDERLEILNQPAQDEVFGRVHDTATGRRPATIDEGLLVLLLGNAAMLQYHVRTMRGRGPRRLLEGMYASLPAGVQAVVGAYERWQVHGAAD
jgi:hypothetical protein